MNNTRIEIYNVEGKVKRTGKTVMLELHFGDPELLTLADKVEKQKLLAIGRLAARVVYRNAKKAVEHSVQRTGFACDVDGCKRPGVVHLCEDHGLQ